jgi:hypothetical protein
VGWIKLGENRVQWLIISNTVIYLYVSCNGGFLYWESDYHLFKKNSAPWSLFYRTHSCDVVNIQLGLGISRNRVHDIELRKGLSIVCPLLRTLRAKCKHPFSSGLFSSSSSSSSSLYGFGQWPVPASECPSFPLSPKISFLFRFLLKSSFWNSCGLHYVSMCCFIQAWFSIATYY